MPTSSAAAAKAEKERRFLPEAYGDDQTENKELTEEDWLQKEKKEIEEVEKTVTIRFANYSTLMRAQSLTQGLSAQLAMFLSTMGVNSQGQPIAGPTPAFATKETKSEVEAEPGSDDKLRSLSPLGILEPEGENKTDGKFDEDRSLIRRTSQGHLPTNQPEAEEDANNKEKPQPATPGNVDKDW